MSFFVYVLRLISLFDDIDIFGIQELSEYRDNKVAEASEKHAQWGGGLAMHTKPWVRAR